MTKKRSNEQPAGGPHGGGRSRDRILGRLVHTNWRLLVIFWKQRKYSKKEDSADSSNLQEQAYRIHPMKTKSAFSSTTEQPRQYQQTTMSAASSSPTRRPLGAVNRPTIPPHTRAPPAAAQASCRNPYSSSQHAYVPSDHVKSIVSQISKNRWGVDELRERQALCLSTLSSNTSDAMANFYLLMLRGVASLT